MLLSIGLIILVGLSLGWLVSKAHLPRIIGIAVHAMAVVSIVVTAPIGAIGMDAAAHRFISKDTE